MCQALLLILLSICAAEEKSTPKEIREAKEKVIREKMAPLEKKLKGHREDLEAAKRAPVNGKNQVVKRIGNIGDGRNQPQNYKTDSQKAADVDKHKKAIEELTAKLKPLQEELKELNRKKPETKPKEPTAPK